MNRVTSWVLVGVMGLFAACGGGSVDSPGDASSTGTPTTVASPDKEGAQLEAPTSWLKVADEWQRFTLAQSTTVRYGAGSLWVERVLPAGEHACSNANFGSDPVPGVVKQCEAGQESASAWTLVAQEWQSFTLAASSTVRYGAGTAWVERVLSAGAHTCSNSTFGSDPAPGVVKRCEASAGATPSGSWVFASAEWQSFTLAAAGRVRYGAAPTWIERDAPAGSVACTNTAFGRDPVPGVVKSCEVWQGDTTPPPPPPPPPTTGWTLLVNEGSAFTLATAGVVRYGAGTSWVERSLAAGNHACNNTAFGSDPLVGTVKRCELSGTGGGGGGGGGSSDRPTTRTEAARFLTQATFGPTDADIDRLMLVGYSAWIDEQFAKPVSSHRDAYRAINQAYVGSGQGSTIYTTGSVNAFWKHALSGEDQLRQRVAYALSQIMVISTQDSVVDDNNEAASAYLDMLADKGLGSYRELLESVALNPLMGTYLSHLRNRKADPRTGRVPDENFAREVMQLFSIGLVELNSDGTPRSNAGALTETYTDKDVAGLAKVFTGYSWSCADRSGSCFYGGGLPGFSGRPDWFSPMVNYLQFYSLEGKEFLGQTLPAASPGNPQADLKAALDTLANHPNVGPFIGRQLIQRLVTSNPSTTYVADVARVFAGSGGGRGDMKAVIKVILMHPEARLMSATSGKVREPVLRLSALMRAFGHRSSSGYFWVNMTDNPGTQLGQSPLRAPSVFNFYRPGYAAPGSLSAARGLVAPELQVVHETTAAGYVNFMRDSIDWGVGWDLINNRNDFVVDLNSFKAVADQPATLIDRVTSKLLYIPVPAELRQDMVAAVQSIALPAPAANGSNLAWIDTLKEWRVKAVMLLTVASPEFQVQR